MAGATTFQPLYKQVYTLISERIARGEMKPAQSLPSEFALADELGVSQGTVRKALDKLVAEKILERRQGKGTYVAKHTQEKSLFRFFRFREPGGESLIPETTVISRKTRVCSAQEAKRLNLDSGQQVHELSRLRSLKGVPTIVERIIQPLDIFPGLDKEEELPNSLYSLYQERYDISIVEVREEIKATALPAKVAKRLDLPAKAPALLVSRVSVNIDGRAVEWSEAFCQTDQYVYSVNLN